MYGHHERATHLYGCGVRADEAGAVQDLLRQDAR